MERVYDWDLESWRNAIYAILDPLTVLVGTAERKTTPTQDRKLKTRSALPPPEYASSEDSDSGVESPKRMPMRRPPRVMQLVATLAEPEAPSTEGPIPKALEDAIVRLMQSTRMQTNFTRDAAVCSALREPTPASRRAATEAVLQESTDVAMASASSRSLSCSNHGRRTPKDARARLLAFSELKEFKGTDTSAEKARAWFNRLKSASRCDGMTGGEVCALFGDLIAGPPRQWYLQLKKSTRTSGTELTDQFRVQYCGKGVSMASRYYHASKHVDETPLEYLYRLNVAGMRAKIRYSDGTSEEEREHVELFINTLGAQEQELASRLTLMEVPDTATLEKKLRARQRSLAHQKKTPFGSNRFRQKAQTSTPTPARAHAVQIMTDEYDSGREGDSDEEQICDQDRGDEDRAKLFVTGHAPQQDNARQDFDTGGTVHDRPRCRHCGSRRHSKGDC
ncbi:Eukaryotic/viral aspartic protease [Phytophthora megakarya]|uniref:Eukaryotic/viral aspartic protease n=1 Tax=Phytophthora megakarya TaxID=4795 RepID=A0A225UMI0_9STRA|nr:Eukaryotic/viral aspartic protease [Phytophthora megakarya]